MKNTNNKKGIVRLIVLIFIVIFILSYFNIDLSSLFNNGALRNNLDYIWRTLSYVWNDLIYGPIDMMIDKVISMIPQG